jgi:predicted nucleic acid-binding protein
LLTKSFILSKFLDKVKKLIIPKIVYQELIDKKETFDALLIKKEIRKNRIVIKDVDKRLYINILKHFKLDEGEAATYALFKHKKGKAILTDDRELIKLCKIEGIPFICAMAIVVRLFEKNILSKEDALDKLENLYAYGRYTNDIYKFFKGKVLRNLKEISDTSKEF